MFEEHLGVKQLKKQVKYLHEHSTCVFTGAGVILCQFETEKLLAQYITLLLQLATVADVLPTGTFNCSNPLCLVPLHQSFHQVHLKVQGTCT